MKGNVLVVVSRKYKRVTMQRVLVSKLVWDIDNFTGEDLLALFDNQLFLEDLAARDPSFRSKFQSDLESISNYLKAARIKSIGDLPKVANRFQKFIRIKLSGFIYPQRNFKNQHAMYRRYVEFRYNQPQGVPIKELPPVKYIGKGYTDKGTAKKPHLDGSPSWQEVATGVPDEQ